MLKIESLIGSKYEYAMSYFHSHFSEMIRECFGINNIVMAYLFGSIIRKYANFTPGSGADLDMFVCLEDDTPDLKLKISNFRSWYKDFHVSHGLSADLEYPGEVMMRSQLDCALSRQSTVNIKFHNNSLETLDTVSWAPMIIEKSLKKIGKEKDILKYQKLCNYDKKWIESVLNKLEFCIPPQEMFHRLARFFIPWIREFSSYLAKTIDLKYDQHYGYYCPIKTTHLDLYNAISYFCESNPIITENNQKKLRQWKNRIIIDFMDDIDISAFSVFLSNPESILSAYHLCEKYSKSYDKNFQLVKDKNHIQYRIAGFTLKWQKEIITDLRYNHPIDIASYTMRGIIDWYHKENKRIFNIQIPRKNILMFQRRKILLQAIKEVSNLTDIIKKYGVETEEELDFVFSDEYDPSYLYKNKKMILDKLHLNLPTLQKKEWALVLDEASNIYFQNDIISTINKILELIMKTPSEYSDPFQKYQAVQRLIDYISNNNKDIYVLYQKLDLY